MRLPFHHSSRPDNRNSLYRDMDVYTLIRMVADGVLVGAVAGFFAATFRYLLGWLEIVRIQMMSYMNWQMVLLWLLGMCVAALIVYRLLKWAPLSGGSGIPQIEGEMLGLFDMGPVRTLISKYLGGALTILGGFSVGREGPSIQVGGSVGKIISYLLQRPLREERILISAGSAAGLTAAFSAPVSGALFIFEEVHKSFYPAIIIPTFTAALMSNFVTSFLFGLQPALGFSVMSGLPIRYFGYLLLLGLFAGIVGVIFNRVLLLFKKSFARVKLHQAVKIIITFLVVSMIGYDSQILLGGGNQLVGELAYGNHTVLLLASVLAGKILLTSFCFGSGVQGGIFLPILVIGAAAGALFEQTLAGFGLISNFFGPHFVICAMAGILASAIRTPLLSIMLVLEMTNSFNNIYAIGTVAIVAYLTAELMQEPPVYDSLLKLMLVGRGESSQIQTFFEARISVISGLVGNPLKELQIPHGVIIVSIDRHGQQIVPMATTKLYVGDELYISCTKEKLEEAKNFFQK